MKFSPVRSSSHSIATISFVKIKWCRLGLVVHHKGDRLELRITGEMGHDDLIEARRHGQGQSSGPE